jgi:hypothetical protein
MYQTVNSLTIFWGPERYYLLLQVNVIKKPKIRFKIIKNPLKVEFKVQNWNTCVCRNFAAHAKK